MLLCTGGYGTVFYLSTNAVNSNVTAASSARTAEGRVFFANPCFTQIHPTCIPVSGDPPVQADADVGKPAQRRTGLGTKPAKATSVPPSQIPEAERDYYLERRYPSFGNLVPRDVASRAAKAVCDEGRGAGDSGLSVYLDFAAAIQAWLNFKEHPDAAVLIGGSTTRWYEQGRTSGSGAKPPICRGIGGALGRTRTCGLLIRSQTLYPAELRAHRSTHDTAGWVISQGGRSLRRVFMDILLW